MQEFGVCWTCLALCIRRSSWLGVQVGEGGILFVERLESFHFLLEEEIDKSVSGVRSYKLAVGASE